MPYCNALAYPFWKTNAWPFIMSPTPPAASSANILMESSVTVPLRSADESWVADRMNLLRISSLPTVVGCSILNKTPPSWAGSIVSRHCVGCQTTPAHRPCPGHPIGVGEEGHRADRGRLQPPRRPSPAPPRNHQPG